MSRPALAVVAALVLGGAVGYEQLPPPPRPVPVTGSAEVIGATVVCPDVRSGPGVRTRLSVASTAGTGTVTAQPLRGRGGATALPVDRGGVVAVDAGGRVGGDAVVVVGRGSLAGGLEVEQVSRGESGGERGFAGMRCTAPATQSWFVGGSTKVGHAALLVLTNADDTPAVVDVTVWTGDGTVDPRPGRGVVVAPRSRATVPLDQLAPDRDLLALRVVSERGRVAAAVRHARVDGRTPNGVEWVPEAVPPAATVVVPGLPRGPGRRVVHVTNPGPDPTVVQLQLTTENGQEVPVDLASLAVGPGTTVAADLTRYTDRTATTVTVTSDGGPVLAGGFVFDARGEVKEMAYVGSAPALTGPALLTDVTLDPSTESTLLLTASEGAGSVLLTPLPVVGGAPAVGSPRQVDVPAGRTVAVRLSTFLPPGATGRLAVQVTPAPGSGPVHAARYLRENADRGPLTTALSLRSGGHRVAVPVVRRDPWAGLTR